MNQPIPSRYSCDGEDVNPPLSLEGIPSDARSLALIVDDPDAPGRVWVHWTLWNIDPKTKDIAENSLPSGAVQGRNDFGQSRWGGPCPPGGTHHYRFRLFALKAAPDLPAGAKEPDLAKAIQGKILAQAELIGSYQRSK